MPNTIKQTMGPCEWSMLILLSLLWGGSFFFVELVIHQLAPLSIVLIRVALAAPALWLLALLLGRRLPRAPRIWLAFVAMGLLNNVLPFTLIAWGQIQIASGLAAILNATTPLFTVVVAGLLLADEHYSIRKLVGVGLGFAGIAVMLAPDLLEQPGAGLLAQCAVLAAALSYALAAVFGRRFRKMGVDSVVTAAGQVTASALILLPVVLLLDPPSGWLVPTRTGIAALLALGLLSTALAYLLYFRLLESAGATNLALVTLLIPISAILLGVLLLGERLEPRHYGGMLLTGLGLLAIQGRGPWRRLPG